MSTENIESREQNKPLHSQFFHELRIELENMGELHPNGRTYPSGKESAEGIQSLADEAARRIQTGDKVLEGLINSAEAQAQLDPNTIRFAQTGNSPRVHTLLELQPMLDTDTR